MTKHQQHTASEPEPQQQPVQGELLSLDPVSTLSLWERTKYTAGTALTIGGLAELIGFGGLSLFLGVAGGAAGYIFSEEKADFLLKHLPAPKKARGSSQSRLHWWLTGETLQHSAREDEEEDYEAKEDEDEQAIPHHHLSCEPLVELVTLLPWLATGPLDWVIVGGYSGQEDRPMKLEWARALKGECAAFGVAFFFKQLETVYARQHGLRNWKGEDPAEFPADLRVQQFPER